MPVNIDSYEAMAGDVLALYGEAERAMLRRVAARLNRGVDRPGWAEMKYAEVRDVTRELGDYVARLSATRRDMTGRFVSSAYGDARAAFLRDVRAVVERARPRSTLGVMRAVNILSELDSGMDAADRRILRTASDAYAGIVGRASAMAATGSSTVGEAVRRELDDFAKRGIASFVDRAGRSWDMETYAEMATLTAMERATRWGYIDAMAENNFDLAQISDHYGACPICEAWQGVVVSISGTTSGYPALSEAESAGVFHPRCMHDISVYHEGISPGGRIQPREIAEDSPGYSVRAQQRGYERQERAWKRRMAVAATPEDERAAYAKVRSYQAKIRDLRERYNAETPRNVDYLPRKYGREGGRVKLSAAAKRLRPGSPGKK